MSFTHLHVHTTWSRFDGLARINELFTEASRMRQPGLAITDHGTMAGVPEFLTVAAKYPQVKPIVGCEFYLAEESISKPSDRNFHLVLLAKNLTGYHTLLKLCSIAGTDGLHKGKPRIDHKALSEYHEGLIALSACIGGEIPQAILEKDMEKARDLIRWYRNLFGEDFYLEVSQHNSRKRYYKGDVPKLQAKANKGIFLLGKELGVKVVATNDVHMVEAQDYKAHEVLLCCNTKTKMEPDNKYFYTGEEYLKSEEAMLDIFADHPEVISNTSEILDKIERFDIKSPIQLPDFPLPKGYDTPEAYLRYIAKEGLKSRTLKSSNPKWGQRGEQDRLDYELQVVTEKGFTNYFLILWDIVRAVRDAGHIVGPGRDSTPSSFLCYVLGITDVDPIEVSLAFEQFISPESGSLPDVNIDFDIEGRQIAYAHLQKTFAKDHVSRMGAYGRRYFKRSIKQVSEVHGIIETDNNDKFINEATRLIKTIISAGMHPSAVLLSRNQMTEYLPVRKKWNSDTRRYELVSDYDAYHAEEMGVLKLDFLSHRDLDVIREVSSGITIPDTFDDPQVYDLFSAGNTEGITMFESAGIKQELLTIKPRNIGELSQIYAMYLPEPMDRFHEYMINKRAMDKGEEPKYTVFGSAYQYVSEYLNETFGLIVYQEQLMLIARRFGLREEDAERFRKAITKKKENDLETLRPLFLSGGKELGLSDSETLLVWDGVRSQGIFAFLKSQAYAYAVIAYRMAWLKVHYPAKIHRALTNNIDRSQ